ncbi:MAG: hypothetical protein A3K60_03800 [Euryarchaeota archaeon RBG_19FT_COMBO_56_21]|nr:MAG: hypothetical protein A3K60_03800 [Euryarchaeota archaeon RBG_19FT_COMBO_56_21]
MKVKICGITSSEDAAMCEDMGADALGFVHFEGRSRSLPFELISEICSSLGPITSKVLVCKPANVDSSLAMLADSGAEILQLYSLQPEELSELRDHGIKVLRVVKPSSGEAERFASAADALVFEDGTPGTGAVYDYTRIPFALRSRSFVAGGLTPENVHLAKALRPYGVDVSSGVEVRPGRKDPGKVETFIRRCKT